MFSPVVLLCIGLVCFLDYTFGARVYDIESVSGMPKYDKTWIDWKTIRVTKIADNKFTLTGEMITHYNFGEDQKIDIKIYRLNDNGKRYPAPIYSDNKNCCQFMKTDKLVYPDLVKYSNLTDVCPLPKGTYVFKKCEFSTDSFPSFIAAGTYKFMAIWYDGTKDVAGLEASIFIH